MSFKTIGAHWYSRPETLGACTDKFLDFLQKIKTHNPVIFSDWYEKAGSKGKALEKNIPLERNNILKLFAKKGKESEFPKISFSLAIWNGKKENEDSSAISTTLGSDESKFFTNNCVINLPYSDYCKNFYKQEKNRQDLLNLFKEIWHPEWIQIDKEKSYCVYKS